MSVIPDARAGAGRTAVELVLRSGGSQPAWISWRPRTRDARRERAVFYAEWVHLLLPGVWVLEGVHEVRVRPAQGEVGELEFEVARGMTVSRVEGESVVSWRYDPDAGRVRVGLSPAQSKPFALRVVSQVGVGSLPLEREVALPSVAGAAGEMGMVGVGTGNDVQVDEVKAEGFATMNLEDFRSAMTAGAPWGTGVGEVVVRRAFRRSGAGGRVTVKASAVEPDVRVESQQTLSLSEDRVVLGAALTVDVIRAGIFKLSFPLPEPLSVESASGPALSHWTELKTDSSGRVVTLHLKGKTQGQQAFNLVLTGPGLRSTNGWVAPRISLREATRQRGQMTVVPEQGLRLRSVQREGVTQLDPQQTGVRQKGALAFRLLQDPWLLTFDLERVDAWVQVLGVQHVAFGEALSRVTVNLQYEIENAGLKALVLRLPAAADSVKFTGEQVGQFAMLPAAEAGGTVSYRDWEVRLDRRLLGRYLLRASYTLPLAAQASEARVVGVRAMDASLQRGFLMLEGSGRLHVVPEPGASLQPADAQSIPRGLQEGIAGVTASHVFRVVEPEYALPVRLERHQAARLLPARVTRLEMDTVVSDEGSMLTRARLGVVPGDKRLLHVKLPMDDGFWFALVNQHSVVPWQATNEILIPLERNAKQGEASTVEILYLKKGTGRVSRALDVELEGPRFDLPLENIRWNVHLNGRWQVRRWKGPLQLESQTPWQGVATEDVQSYLQGEAQQRKAETHEAEQFLNLANSLLVTGNPQDARRAFQAAYGLSQHDQAFNEDARVQLDNLRRQQALVGLNVRQARVGTEGGRAADAPPVAGTAGTLAYTQAQAKQWMERNSAEENAIQERLAERLIQQQDAAVANPAAIRASLPVEGSRLTFTRPLEVNPWASLKLRLEARSTGEFSWGWRLLVLGVTFLGLAVVSRLTRA
ncbi:MAG: hypothetical protein IT580_09185 [Verrucomicrobiales bacterium]|nr:hypothetical protein [Verrucomicrobiales bacterium]